MIYLYKRNAGLVLVLGQEFIDGAHFTSPSSSNLVFVSVSKGVDANTHTPPLLSLTAVDRPPTGKPRMYNEPWIVCKRMEIVSTKSRERAWWPVFVSLGLCQVQSTYREKVQTSLATCKNKNKKIWNVIELFYTSLMIVSPIDYYTSEHTYEHHK